MIRKLVVILFVSLFVKYATAQNSCLSFKTNLVSWAVLEPNLQLEYGFARHFSIALGGGYGWWGFNGRQNALQNWNVGGSINYYFSKNTPFTRHHLGVSGQGGQFDMKWGRTGKRGKYKAVGIVYGYTWQISRSFLIDAGLGAGYIQTSYTKYKWLPKSDCFMRLEDVAKRVPGLMQLNVSFIYRL